jgi:hypothetical protein
MKLTLNEDDVRVPHFTCKTTEPLLLTHRITVFFWTFPSSGILETRKNDVSETGSVSGPEVIRGRRHLLSWAPYKQLISITGPLF